MILQKKSEYTKDIEFKNQVLNLSDPDLIHDKYINPLLLEKDRLKQKLFLENIKSSNHDFEFKIKKLMFDIKRNPKTRKYLADCLEYINSYKKQQKPLYMNYDEWQQIKLKESDVIKKLKNTLRLQHPKSSQQDKLIKDRYNLRLNDLKIPIYEAVTEGYYPFKDTKYEKLVDKK